MLDSRIYLGRQREPNVKALPFLLRQFHSPLSAEFLRLRVFSGGTQRCALPIYQKEQMKIINTNDLLAASPTSII